MTIIDKKENQILINIESALKEKEDEDDPEELERITRNLRDDLTELDAVETVDLVIKEGEVAQKAQKLVLR